MTRDIKTDIIDETTDDTTQKEWHVTVKRYEYVRISEPILARTEQEAIAIAEKQDYDGTMDYDGLKPVSDGFEHDWSDAEANAL